MSAFIWLLKFPPARVIAILIAVISIAIYLDQRGKNAMQRAYLDGKEAGAAFVLLELEKAGQIAQEEIDAAISSILGHSALAGPDSLREYARD